MLKSSPKIEFFSFYLFFCFLFFCLYSPFYWGVISWRADYSKEFLFTVSQKTKELLISLDRTIFVEVFDTYKRGDIGYSLLEKMSRINKNIRIKYIDIYKNPSSENNETNKFIKGTIRFSSDFSENCIDLLPKDLWGNQGESFHEQKFFRVLTIFLQEKKISSKRFIFFKESGERRVTDYGPNGLSELSRILKSCGFLIQEVELSSQSEQGFFENDIFVVFGPRQKITSSKQNFIFNQIYKKKRNLVLFLDPSSDSGFQEVGLKNILKNWGVFYLDGVLVDRENFARTSSSSGSIFFPILSVKEGIFSDLLQKQLGAREYRVAFFTGRSISMESNSVSFPVLETSSRAYQEMNLQSLQKSMSLPNNMPLVFYEPGVDKEGPLVGVGVIHTKGDQRIIFGGDSGFAANRVIDFYDNKSFLLSCFLWVAGKEFLLYSVPHKNIVFPRILLSVNKLQNIYLVRLFLMSLLPIIIFCFLFFYQNRGVRRV